MDTVLKLTVLNRDSNQRRKENVINVDLSPDQAYLIAKV